MDEILDSSLVNAPTNNSVSGQVVANNTHANATFDTTQVNGLGATGLTGAISGLAGNFLLDAYTEATAASGITAVAIVFKKNGVAFGFQPEVTGGAANTALQSTLSSFVSLISTDVLTLDVWATDVAAANVTFYSSVRITAI